MSSTENGKGFYSLEYSHALICHRFWVLLFKRRTGRKVGAKYLQRVAREAGLVPHINEPLHEVLRRRDDAWEAYKQVKKKSRPKRDTFLEGLATAREEAGMEKAAKGLIILKHRERQRHRSRILKSILNPTQRKGLARVKRPDVGVWDNGEWRGTWKEVTDKDGVEDACLFENNRKLHQASKTDLMQPEVIDILGPTGCSSAATDLLYNGVLGDLPLYLNDPSLAYIRECQVPYEVKWRGIFSLDHSTTGFSTGWQKAKEATSSSYSMIHFGHYIARSHDPELAAMDAAFARIPAISGYSPNRWQNGLNVMMDKKAGEIRVTKLRTLVLFEADFNQNNKSMARSMMANAEKYNLIAPEHYGSRKHHNAQDQGLNKVLLFDILRQKRQRAALNSVDRIVHTAAGLTMRRVGAPAAVIESSFTTIAKLEHYIRTVYGDSTKSFTSRNDKLPPQGVGQGNGTGPGIWAVASTPIFDSMRRRGYGLYLESPLSGEKSHFVGYAFVDDTDLCTSDPPGEAAAATLIPRVQESLNWWESSCRTTGGAVVPEKSHWFLIDFCGKKVNGFTFQLKQWTLPLQYKIRTDDGKW
jgi:hypothetical protein